jgi:hypothetical protein
MPIRGDRPYAVLMSTPIILTVSALAVARITRMITADKIFDRPRRALVLLAWIRAYPWIRQEPEENRTTTLAMVMANHAQDPPLLAYLAFCPWCVSIWVSAAAAPAVWFWGGRPWLFVPALALAFSQVTGLLATREG